MKRTRPEELPAVRGVDLKGFLLEDINVDTWRELIWGIFDDGTRSILGKALLYDPEKRARAADEAARITLDTVSDPRLKHNGEINLQMAVDFCSLSEEAVRKANLAWDFGPLDNKD